MKETKKLEKTCRFLEKVLNTLNTTQRKNHEIEKILLFVSSLIEKSADKSSYLSFLHASLLFRLGQITNKKPFCLLALKKLQNIELYHGEYDLLWGKILLFLASFSDDEKLIEDAIKKFLNVKDQFEAIWCLGLAHTFLGKRSFEVTDFNQAIGHYGNVDKCEFPLFWLDYAESLYILGSFTHNIETLQNAIEILKKIIVDAESVTLFCSEHVLYGKDERGYGRVWTIYIKVLKRVLELKEEAPQTIDSHFFDAISAVPSESLLWTEWSELYVRQGWLKKDFSLIESGLNHISHTFFGKVSLEKDKEGQNPRSVPTGHWFEPIIFAEALATLGLFTEELKLMKEAEKIIHVALEVLPNNAEVWHASGVLHLVYGLYYSDRKYLLEAISSFKKGLEIYNRSFFLWHGLFEAYFSLAILENDDKYFEKAIDVNEYLLNLRPNSPLLHHESALILLQFGVDNEDLLYAACEKFEEVLALDGDSKNNSGKYLYRYAEALDRLGEITGHTMYFEKGIDLLSKLQETGDQTPASNYSLALLYAHLGAHEEDEESLYRAHYLFESCAKKRGEDDYFYSEWGNVLLHLIDIKTTNTVEGKKLIVKAEERLMKALEYGNAEAHYLLACLYSITLHFELSLEHLQKAHEKGVLPHFDDLEQDNWLEKVRNTHAFQNFAKGLS